MINIEETVELQRGYFNSNITKEIAFRRTALARLKHAILQNESEICEALNKDLNKSDVESYMSEIGMVLSELTYTMKHLNKWSKRKYIKAPLAQFPARSFSIREPFGVVLIIAPWNYPFLLCIEPLIGAIAAGNCCIIKPSEFAPSTAVVIAKVIKEVFKEKYITVVNGDKDFSAKLLEQRFDYIFYTGGEKVGKLVMKQASRYLTPVTLELGGKSPCIVDETADLQIAARRIAFGKCLNSGQTCVAPDYLLIQREVKQEFLKYFSKELIKMYGQNILASSSYPKMINERHYERVMSLIHNQKVIIGGHGDRHTLKIEPTVLDDVQEDNPIMQQEIFGPVLPIITFENSTEAINYIKKREKPLALYLFTKSKKMELKVINEVSYGGGCINDTIVHLASSNIPFGGVGNSGMGNYHGKYTFDIFSHEKGIMKRYNHVDIPLRYQPYNNIKKRFISAFLR